MASPRSLPAKKKGKGSPQRGGVRRPPAGDPSPSWLSSFAGTFWPPTAQGRLILLGILALALVLRAYDLVSLFPILVDESIYLRWAEIIDHQGQWFISLIDGKEPLTYWLLAVLRKSFGGDPLLEGRALSVAAGLLSTMGVFAVGRRVGSETAGLLAAGLYACLPYALLYDRIAYTEAFVNLFSIGIVLASLSTFAESHGSRKRDLAAGLVLGLGLFTKQTLFLLAFFPLLVGLSRGWSEKRRLAGRLLLTYGVAAAFVLISLLMTPSAPKLETHDAFVHHTGFFVPFEQLVDEPFKVAPSNLRKLGGYVSAYITWPLLLAGVASLGYLVWRRSHAVWLLAAASLVPLLVQVFVLELMYPSRYPFPHAWPWLVLVGWASAEAWNRYHGRLRRPSNIAAALAAGLLIAGPMVWRSICLLQSPRECLHPEDARNFLGSSAHAGFGVREAVDFLVAESRTGPFVLLTDPIWGPPADAMFPYLNERHGIRVYEAWWMQLSGDYLILPPAKAKVLKSHYERVEQGTVDFSTARRVFYVTDTNYYTRGAVQIRQPGAQLVASFPKPGGEHSVDVYRLK